MGVAALFSGRNLSVMRAVHQPVRVASRGRVFGSHPGAALRRLSGATPYQKRSPDHSETAASRQRAYPTFEATARTKGALRCSNVLRARVMYWWSVWISFGPADLYPNMR